MHPDSIPARLLDQARRGPDRCAYRTKAADGTWTPTTWGAYAEQTRRAAKALIATGLEPGDTACMLGFNTPEWVTLDVATMMAGGVPAGIYTTCSPEEVAYIVTHSEARVVLVEDEAQYAKITAEGDQLAHVTHVVFMAGASAPDDGLALDWEAFLALGDGVDDATLDARLDALEPESNATFIYTSGTTGPPKAVMLTHDNLVFTADTAIDMVQAASTERFISYLPLSHIAEQMFSIHGHLTAGYELWFAESLDKVVDNLKDVRPTILFAVPRVWEKIHAKLSAVVRTTGGLKGFLLRWAMGIGQQVHALRHTGEEPEGLLALQYRLADRVIYSKIKAQLGLDDTRFGISGAAPIASEILEFFSGLDIMILEVYGQSEDCGPTTFNLPGRTRLGTVGPAIPGVTVRIADDGEILVKGRNVFKGYYKNPEATAETLEDGWLHSGDLGSLDDDGFLTITGRKKEILITAGGKNIAPKNIEAALKNLPLVSQAVVIGDRRRFLSALITLDTDAATAWAEARGLPPTDLHTQAELVAALQQAVDEQVNPRFARVEHVRKFTVLPRDLTIEDGELTATMKVKRRVVDEHFAEEIEAMYA